MEYAIIETGGKQYKVNPGSIVEVEKLDVEAGKEHVFDKVLLYTNNGVFKIGQPSVAGVNVKAKVIGQVRGEKIRVSKFKAKARYRKVTGHRQVLTRVQITEIAAVKEKKEK